MHIYDLVTGGLAQKLPEFGNLSGGDASGYYHSRQTDGAPCRDISWHPHYPVLASTSFDGTVKIWTLQTNQRDPEAERLEEERLMA